jgi:hypothetical protein
VVRSRASSIRAGYEGQSGHDTPRPDPACKLLADRSPEDDQLASQPVLSRFENAIGMPSLKRLGDVFLDQSIASFHTPPGRLTLDRDGADGPAHGRQQLTCWHGSDDPLVTSAAAGGRQLAPLQQGASEC